MAAIIEKALRCGGYVLVGLGAVLLLAGGSWNNPGLPSGTVAFVRQGDVWIENLPGGDARRITTDGRNFAPSLSPSAQWVAFRKNEGEAWVARVDGSSVHALREKRPVRHLLWSPVSDLLASVTEGSLRVEDADGGRAAVLVANDAPEPGTGVYEIAWSPDGAWIAYLREGRRVVPEGEWPLETSIEKVSAGGGKPMDVLRFPVPVEDEDGDRVPGNAVLAGWFFSHIFYWQCRASSASLMADGCPLYSLGPEGNGFELPVSLLYPDSLSISPGGKRLAVAEGGDRRTWTEKRITVVDLRNGRRRALTGPDTSALSPRWSPDGKRLAFVSGPNVQEDGNGNDVPEGLARRRIAVMDADGSSLSALTADGRYRDECPRWSADGGHILFARVDGGRTSSLPASLWAVPSTGGSPVEVAEEMSPFLSESDPLGLELEYYGHREWDRYFDWAPAEGRSVFPLAWTGAAMCILGLALAGAAGRTGRRNQAAG